MHFEITRPESFGFEKMHYVHENHAEEKFNEEQFI